MTTVVYADLRWQTGTGIGAVKSELLARVSSELSIVDLCIGARIGSPWSPMAISAALSKRRPTTGVFWSPGYMPPMTARLPAVVTVHDLTHLHYYTEFHAVYYNAVMRRLYRRCRAIICVSEYTRAELVEWSGISADRVWTVPNGVSPKFFRETDGFGLEFPYILYPGNRRAYKNIGRMLQAYAESGLSKEGIHFVLTGAENKRLQRLIEEMRLSNCVHFVGYVSEGDMVRLYRGATLIAFVSLYEGFGLPIAEGMAAGVPVVTSNVSAMPEVAGGAAVLVDPTAVPEIAEAMRKASLDQEYRKRLITLGKVRAREFDWDIAAQKVWKIIRDAAKSW